MNPYGPGKPKTYHLWVDDAGDGKGSNKPGSQLAVLHLKGQVTGGEPDPLANLIGRSRCAVLAHCGDFNHEMVVG